MEADWTRYKRGDRVILNFGYRGFPASVGTVLHSKPYGLEVLFDGEDEYRVLPFSMVKHATQEQLEQARC